jgi:ABC-type dipeptide/oligopeptide/nickel transport system permease subunit
MKRKTMDKGIAAGAVTLFFAAVRPDSVPQMWITVMLALALYEAMLYGIRSARRQARRERKRHYVTATRIDMKRVAEQVFNPIREVS